MRWCMCMVCTCAFRGVVKHSGQKDVGRIHEREHLGSVVSVSPVPQASKSRATHFGGTEAYETPIMSQFDRPKFQFKNSIVLL